jgi:hypothetical protein
VSGDIPPNREVANVESKPSEESQCQSRDAAERSAVGEMRVDLPHGQNGEITSLRTKSGMKLVLRPHLTMSCPRQQLRGQADCANVISRRWREW